MDELKSTQKKYSEVCEKIEQLNEQAFQLEQEMMYLIMEQKNKNGGINNESNVAKQD